MITIEKVGARLYLTGNTYPVKERIKAIGGHWDGDRRAWWVGATKAAAAEELVNAPAEKPKVSDDSKIVGKAEYKGRNYYVLWVGTCKTGERKAHLTVLDGSIDFWAAEGNGEGQARIVKTYAPRGHTTLGGLRQFVERQKNPATRRGECYECGAYGPSGESCSECGGEGTYM